MECATEMKLVKAVLQIVTQHVVRTQLYMCNIAHGGGGEERKPLTKIQVLLVTAVCMATVLPQGFAFAVRIGLVQHATVGGFLFFSSPFVFLF
jgi:hypothetical protein